RIVDEHVETSELVADAFRRGSDGSLIRHVELERVSIAVDRFGCLISPRIVARTDQDSEVLRGQLLCDLEADPLICPGDQSDRFVLHSNFLFLKCYVANTVPLC